MNVKDIEGATGSGAGCSIPCNACGATEVLQVSDRDRDGRPLRTVLCTGCGLVWTDPRPSAEAIKGFYTHHYRSSYKGSAEPKRKHILRETRRAIARFRRIQGLLRPGARVLDVGAGAGFFPYVVRSRGFEVVGLEPNQGYCDWGNRVLGVEVMGGTLQDFDLSATPFDIITLNHVLEHLPDPAAALSRLRDWLEPEGLLVVEVPNIESGFHAPHKRFHIGHLYNFSPDNLTRLARSRGLEVHDLFLQPGTAHINVVFRKADVEDPLLDRRLPGAALRVREVLRRHSSLAHYASPGTHLRSIRKWVGYVGERLRLMGAGSARQIVDREIEEAFGPTVTAADTPGERPADRVRSGRNP